ncbi:MAG: DinB family protein [Chloroflexi bacterium]|nr:DinB family protein [Chloroflexota bacterium]
MNVAPFYEGWRQFNDRLVEAIGPLSAEELAWAPAPRMWPIWALAAHIANTRVYWLCSVLGEPGVETTPFTDPSGEGWEDDLSRPRQADELVRALRSSWSILDACLQRWTPEMLRVEFRRKRDDLVQLHTRQSILIRLLTHDASHTGEISQLLGSHGRGGIDLWSGLSRVLPATT